MIDHGQGNFEVAESRLIEAVTILQRSLGRAHPITAIARMDLGRILTQLGEFDRARQELRAASSILVASVGTGHELYANTEIALGVLARNEKDYAKALEHYRVSLQILSEIYGTTPHIDVAVVISDIAVVESLMGENQKAEGHIRQSLAMSGDILGEDSPAQLPRLINLGAILAKQKKFAEAKLAFEKAIRVGTPAFGESNRLVKAARRKIQEIEHAAQ